MRRSLLFPTLIIPLALAAPGVAQAQNVPQLLQGMMTGNQNQDQKIRDAYERGYQKGRQDEAQFARSNRPDDRSNNRGGYGQAPAPYPRQDDYRR